VRDQSWSASASLCVSPSSPTEVRLAHQVLDEANLVVAERWITDAGSEGEIKVLGRRDLTSL